MKHIRCIPNGSAFPELYDTSDPLIRKLQLDWDGDCITIDTEARTITRATTEVKFPEDHPVWKKVLRKLELGQ